MSELAQIGFADGEAHIDWLGLTQALAAGHRLPKAEIADSFLYRGADTVLSRAAWIDGLGMAVKTATIFPDNPNHGKATVNGGVSLYDDHDGRLTALVDFHLVTKWKTAGDSLLGALRLAPADSRNILIVGAGTVAASLIEAFTAGFPNANFTLWNRNMQRAQALAARYQHGAVGVAVADDLATAVAGADIVLTATMSRDPVILGDWLREGAHVNLIGAYRPDMREVDDTALTRSRIYVDSFDTTLDHIGELKDPLSRGVIAREDVVADFYTLDDFAQGDGQQITLFKNGGGAHLDLMTADYILRSWQQGQR
jgi:ornithine cyclodeaminase